MKITDISLQSKNPNRVNISIDGRYRLSLDVFQVTELGLRRDQEISEEELERIEQESQFGKLYARALEYCLMRPHSGREVRDYLYRKTRDSYYLPRQRPGQTKQPERKLRKGVSPDIADRVYDRLVDKGYIDDEKFARFWVENRNLRKGSSTRKLASELSAKGVSRSIIESVIAHSERNDETEIAKIIAKKRIKYPDERKLIAYLARQGFGYDDIRTALDTLEE